MSSAITEGADGWLAKTVSPASEIIQLVIYTANTVDAGDTVAIDLSKYGMQTPLAIFGNSHTAAGELETEAPTVSVSGTTMTITVIGGTDDDTRSWVITGLGYGITWTALT